MSFYNEWGFWDEPFSFKPLGDDEIGSNLLVGRELEKKNLKLRLRETNKICTIEGEIGIGKTSLANVVLFECYNEWTQGDEQPLLIPCKLKFQLKEDLDIDEFRNKIMNELAGVLVKYKDILNDFGVKNINSIEKFFNPELVSSRAIGASALGFGGNVSEGKSLNNSRIFQDDIFYKIVEETLNELAKEPEMHMGGIVCLIDNVELVKTHKKVGELVELMRDKIFNIPFTKWILCGETDVFMSVVESPRMSAYIHKPILVKKLEANVASDMFNKRYAFYGGSYLPCSPKEFESLFRILDGNTRDVFELMDEYCYYIYEHGYNPEYEHDKEEYFGNWLDEMTIKYIRTTIRSLECNEFEMLFKLCKSKISNIEKFIRNYEREEAKQFLENIKEQHFIKVYEDGKFKYLRKGSLVKYYFETFSRFEELEEDLENTYDIFTKKVSKG